MGKDMTETLGAVLLGLLPTAGEKGSSRTPHPNGDSGTLDHAQRSETRGQVFSKLHRGRITGGTGLFSQP